MLKPPCSEHIFRKSHKAQLHCLSTVPSLQLIPFLHAAHQSASLSLKYPKLSPPGDRLGAWAFCLLMFACLMNELFPFYKTYYFSGWCPASQQHSTGSASCLHTFRKNGQMLKGEQRLKNDFFKSSF